ncbi:hypothetical protein P7K49_008299 [Saguinus oedipus]|uniref:Uncharacterized protein n=1 Tax=Saguinus oedipus TaxID=9490 RepID=A0ABQ9VXB1_SAGOE|nr:hypothetical protein P7K49_008299 [Saguinus oedipus]
MQTRKAAKISSSGDGDGGLKEKRADENEKEKLDEEMKSWRINMIQGLIRYNRHQIQWGLLGLQSNSSLELDEEKLKEACVSCLQKHSLAISVWKPKGAVDPSHYFSFSPDPRLEK